MLLDAFLDQVRGLVPPARQLLLRRIRDLIRVSITDAGESVDVGGRLAPETELMAEYGVTRDAVRDALSQLSDEGLLERRRGLGTLCTVDRGSWDIQLPAEGDSLEQHLAVGRITPRLLHWGWIKAPSLIASKLDDIEPGDNCLCIDYVLMRDGVPSAVITNYLRNPEASRLAPSDFGTDFYSMLDRSGAAMESHDVVLQARNAGEDVALLLQVPEGDAVLWLEQVIRNVNGEAIDFAVGYFRRDHRASIRGISRVEVELHHDRTARVEHEEAG